MFSKNTTNIPGAWILRWILILLVDLTKVKFCFGVVFPFRPTFQQQQKYIINLLIVIETENHVVLLTLYGFL